MILSLLRHGRTEWNDFGRMQGRANIPLSKEGRAQVRSWRVPSAVVDAAPLWISSPLARAVETAEILSGAAPRIEDALTEMDWGEWEGYRLDELRDRYGEEFLRAEAAGLDFRPRGGESPRDVQHRMQRWIAMIATEGRPIVAVTHRGVVRAVFATATGWDMTGKPAIRLRDDALHRFAIDGDGSVSVLECNVPLIETRSGEAG